MASTTFIQGPKPQFDLAYSDVWLPGLYCRRILCFELPSESSHVKAIETIKRGLQSLVDGTPELGGQTVVLPAMNGSKVPWKAIHPYKGVEFVVKDLTETFHSYHELEEMGFPITAFKDQLLIPVPVTIQPDPNAEMLVQANLIKGGLLLSVCLGHNFTDGNGMNAIMIALGEQCRLAAQTNDALPPRKMKTDRMALLEAKGSKTDLKDHPAYGYLEGAFVPHVAPAELDDGATATKESQQRPDNEAVTEEEIEQQAEKLTTADSSEPPQLQVQTRTFRISATASSSLRSFASDGAENISTHDAIAALMWRTLIVARHKAGRLDENKISTYTIPHNARRYLGLPKDWVGNCCYFICASFPVSEIIAPNSLPRLASAIRAALNAVNSDVVGGLMQLRKSCTYDVTWAPLFEANEPWTLMMTSFYHSGLCGIDCGDALGKVKHFTTSDEGAMGGFRNTAFVGPKLFGGGIDASMGLDQELYELVMGDSLWQEYMVELGRR
ncbi:hypothetical protein Q7P37_006556 [Cladosporium fusiforme]